MRIWKNTKTLDDHLDESFALVDPAEANIAVVGGKPINLGDFPKLRGIFKCGIGKDNLPFAEAAERGIKISIASPKTSEIVFAETGNFACHLILTMAYAEVGGIDTWSKTPREFLGAKRLLVIGGGNIGSRVASIMEPLFDVSVYDVTTHQSSDLRPMMERADLVSLHIPLTSTTRGFIDAEKLSWMPSGAALINTARGPIVEEVALLEEISSGRLRAAFDVFWEEPYVGPLRKFHPDRFLMSPHVASTCTAFLEGLTADLQEFGKSLSLC